MIDDILPKLTAKERKYLAERIELAYGEGVQAGYSTIPRFMHYELSEAKNIATTIRNYDSTNGTSETTV